MHSKDNFELERRNNVFLRLVGCDECNLEYCLSKPMWSRLLSRI